MAKAKTPVKTPMKTPVKTPAPGAAGQGRRCQGEIGGGESASEAAAHLRSKE